MPPPPPPPINDTIEITNPFTLLALCQQSGPAAAPVHGSGSTGRVGYQSQCGDFPIGRSDVSGSTRLRGHMTEIIIQYTTDHVFVFIRWNHSWWHLPGQMYVFTPLLQTKFPLMTFTWMSDITNLFTPCWHCPNRADQLQLLSTIVGALGVSGIGASVVRTQRVAANSAGVAGLLALPLSGVLQFLANGSSTMAPTVGEKARDHTKAGAGWQRIARQTRAYRVQLKYLSAGEAKLLVGWLLHQRHA